MLKSLRTQGNEIVNLVATRYFRDAIGCRNSTCYSDKSSRVGGDGPLSYQDEDRVDTMDGDGFCGRRAGQPFFASHRHIRLNAADHRCNFRDANRRPLRGRSRRCEDARDTLQNTLAGDGKKRQKRLDEHAVEVRRKLRWLRGHACSESHC